MTLFRPNLESIGPIRIGIDGVEIMNDDPTNVDVLYGTVEIDPPKYTDLFQKVADDIVNYFANQGKLNKY